jgi:hypothetical protein
MKRDSFIHIKGKSIKREEIIPQKPGIKPNIAKLESTGYLLKDLGECHKWYYKRV